MSSFEKIVHEWQQSRNVIESNKVLAVDLKYSLAAGLPVLAALYALVIRLNKSNRYISANEILAELHPIINLAIGESIKRAEYMGCPAQVPGVPSIPITPLLEELIIL